MKNIFLSSSELHTPLTLEPKEDTFYVLPKDFSETTIHLKLSTPGVQAFVLGLFQTTEVQNITLHQEHSAPETESHVLLKSLVAPNARFSYQGNIHIERTAEGSKASQEARGLLQGENTQFKAIPGLEILPKDVICTHKASSAPINKDSLFTLQTRGLEENEAKSLLEEAFLNGAFDVVRLWNVPEETITLCKEKMNIQ